LIIFPLNTSYKKGLKLERERGHSDRVLELVVARQQQQQQHQQGVQIHPNLIPAPTVSLQDRLNDEEDQMTEEDLGPIIRSNPAPSQQLPQSDEENEDEIPLVRRSNKRQHLETTSTQVEDIESHREEGSIQSHQLSTERGQQEGKRETQQKKQKRTEMVEQKKKRKEREDEGESEEDQNLDDTEGEEESHHQQTEERRPNKMQKKGDG
jgi:hypothetical protein